MKNTIDKEWAEEFDEKFVNGARLGGVYAIEMGKDIKDFIQSLLHQAEIKERERIIEEVKDLKTDERKVAEFGDWQAETYEDKMLVNAVLDDIIHALTSQ